MKKITFTMSVIYDEKDTYTENHLDFIEYELINQEGIKSWDVDKANIIVEDIA